MGAGAELLILESGESRVLLGKLKAVYSADPLVATEQAMADAAVALAAGRASVESILGGYL